MLLSDALQFIPGACDAPRPEVGNVVSITGDVDERLQVACLDFCPIVKEGVTPNLQFVAYRQERRNLVSSPSEYMQITPAIERVQCAKGFGSTLSELNDPFIKLALFPNNDPWAGFRGIFIDRFPHLAGYEYRYQFVFFDARGEIVGSRTSDWVDATLVP